MTTAVKVKPGCLARMRAAKRRLRRRAGMIREIIGRKNIPGGTQVGFMDVHLD